MRRRLPFCLATVFWTVAGTAMAADISTQLSIYNTSGLPGTVTYNAGTGERSEALGAGQQIWYVTALFSGFSSGGVVAHTTGYPLEFDLGGGRKCKVVVLSTVSPARSCSLMSQEYFDAGVCSATIAMASGTSTCGMTLSVKPVP